MPMLMTLRMRLPVCPFQVPLAALGIIGEQFPEMQFPDLLIVGFECLPGRAQVAGLKTCRHMRTPFVAFWFSRAALLEAITTMSSSQDFTNDFAPSSWSRSASSLMLMPALEN